VGVPAEDRAVDAEPLGVQKGIAGILSQNRGDPQLESRLVPK
jgi:hypothetical protein